MDRGTSAIRPAPVDGGGIFPTRRKVSWDSSHTAISIRRAASPAASSEGPVSRRSQGDLSSPVGDWVQADGRLATRTVHDPFITDAPDWFCTSSRNVTDPPPSRGRGLTSVTSMSTVSVSPM